MFAVAAMAIVFVTDSSSLPESPQPIQITASAPQSVSRQISLNQQQIPVDFIGDGTKWWYVRFEVIPPGNEISVKGSLKGYEDIKSIERGVWYPFKQRLSLNLSISQANFESTDSSRWHYSLASAKDLPSNATTKDARDYAQDHTKLNINEENRFIEVLWKKDRGISLSSQQLVFEIPDKKSIPAEQFILITGSDSSWRFVRFKNLGQDVQLILDMDNKKEEVTGNLGLELKKDEKGADSIWYGFRGTMKLKVVWREREPKDIELEMQEGEAKANVEIQTRENAEDAIRIDKVKEVDKQHRIPVSLKLSVTSSAFWPPSSTAVIAAVAGTILLGVMVFVVVKIKNKKKGGFSTQGGAAQTSSPYVIHTQSQDASFPLQNLWRNFLTFGKKRNLPPEAPPKSDVNNEKTGMGEGKSLPGKQLPSNTEATDSQQPTTTFIDQTDTQSPQNAGSLPVGQEAIKKLVEYEFKRLLKAEKKNIVDEVERKFREETKIIEKNFSERINALEQQIGQVQSDTKFLTDVIGGFGEQLEKDSRRFKKIEEQTNEDKKERDSLYAKLLGFLFEANIDALQQNNFASAFQSAAALPSVQSETSYQQRGDAEGMAHKPSEMLNNELRDGIPRADSLDELRQKARAIHDAMKRVADKAAQIARGQADTELAKYVQNAKEIADNIESVQSQLQNRTPELRANLCIKFSAHENARYTFLEELGLAIKREIDRIRDPQGYFRRELERLVTGDIIEVSGICDKQITDGPGRNPELERALQSLFNSAGLKSILPTVGESFDATEQNLIQMLFSQSIQYQKIAEVVSRGFYYNDGKKDVLLRKAGVKVHR
jgi:hypothetical protein